MKIKFLVDYRGVLTGELFYPAGFVVEFDDDMASKLLADGRAVEYVEEVKAAEPEQAKAPQRKQSKKTGDGL